MAVQLWNSALPAGVSGAVRSADLPLVALVLVMS